MVSKRDSERLDWGAGDGGGDAADIIDALNTVPLCSGDDTGEMTDRFWSPVELDFHVLFT